MKTHSRLVKTTVVVNVALWGLVCVSSPLGAAPVAKERVEKAVESWVRHVTADRRATAIIERVEPYQENGETVAYVVHLGHGGYCLAGADSLVLPVYWYSPKGVFDPANPGLHAILREIGGRVGHLRREVARGGTKLRPDRAALDKRARAWDELASGKDASGGGSTRGAGSDASSGETLILPLTSQWGQGSPYNQKCPEIPAGSGNHALVGCVATAAAQIMRFWKWPSTYDWTLINDTHTTPIDSGDLEVARLCHDVGVAVDMNYGLTLSLARTADIEDVLPAQFQYHADAVYHGRDADAMVEELRWFRPLQLRGDDSAGAGHSWVVYGYNLGTSPWQFKMNMGWYGTSDAGWYSVDNVPGSYTVDQAHVTQIAPEDVVKFVSAGTHLGDGSPSSPYFSLESAVTYAPDKATLIFKANSVNTISATPLVISRPLTLKAINAVIK